MAFAPELANENDGMDPHAHDRLDHTQDSSFWFRARNRLIIDLLGRYFGDARDVRRRFGAHVELYQMDARAIPFTEEFDRIFGKFCSA
jgi:hypothetical protein